MKIIYLNAVSDGTGYSTIAIDTILSLDAVGVDVVVRDFKLATQMVQPPARINELRQKSTDGATHVIQHTLPEYFSYYAGLINLGYAHFETTHFRPSTWQFKINLLDGLLVSCPDNEKAAFDSGVDVPITVLPRGINTKLYEKTLYKPLNININGRYAFYHIGDYSSRKNTANLIRCYLEEFSKSDNVVLILKTYVEGTNPQQSLQLINEDIQKIKQGLRKNNINNYPPIILITDYLSNEDIMSLHAQCDCFVTLEKGAGFGLPHHDAAAFGNWVIANGWGGHTQFIKDKVNGNLLNYRFESVSGMNRCPFPYLYTCHEEWADPDYIQMKSLMREVYETKITVSKESRQLFLNEHSYESAGKIIKERLENLV